MRETMSIRYRKALIWGICLFFSAQVISCGTLFYPERRGQTKGEIEDDEGFSLMSLLGSFAGALAGAIAGLGAGIVLGIMNFYKDLFKLLNYFSYASTTTH